MGDVSRDSVDRNDPLKESISLSKADALIMTMLQKGLEWKFAKQK